MELNVYNTDPVVRLPSIILILVICSSLVILALIAIAGIQNIVLHDECDVEPNREQRKPEFAGVGPDTRDLPVDKYTRDNELGEGEDPARKVLGSAGMAM